MKFLIVFAALCAVALAAPLSDSTTIVRQDSEVGPESFDYAVETTDGSKQVASGVLTNVGTDHEALVVKGAYSWFDERTGEKFTVEYIADENGFQPHGAHLPVA